jgi:hypothetical protein
VTTDEMDLVSQALDVTPWRPEAYERARAVLQEAMAESGPRPEAARGPAAVPVAAPAPRRGFSPAGHSRRGTLGTRGKIGIGAGIGAIAAGVAVALAVTSTPQPARPTAQPAARTGSAAQGPAVNSKLISLAAFIKANDNGPLPGNASLVIDTQVIGGKLMQVLYALYTDSGDMYTGDNKQTLMAAVADHANQADSTNAREIAAANYAATGDLATARVRMVDALPNDFFLPLAEREKIWAEGAAARQALLREKGDKTPLTMPTGQALQDQINNSLWTASTIALSWGAGDPEIREGVLRLLSTIPEVTVANSTTGGQPTLTITAGPAVFGNSGDQVLTVNARTGIPVSSVSNSTGVPAAVQTDQVSRVTLANIEAGKF